MEKKTTLYTQLYDLSKEFLPSKYDNGEKIYQNIGDTLSEIYHFTTAFTICIIISAFSVIFWLSSYDWQHQHSFTRCSKCSNHRKRIQDFKLTSSKSTHPWLLQADILHNHLQHTAYVENSKVSLNHDYFVVSILLYFYISERNKNIGDRLTPS